MVLQQSDAAVGLDAEPAVSIVKESAMVLQRLSRWVRCMISRGFNCEGISYGIATPTRGKSRRSDPFQL